MSKEKDNIFFGEEGTGKRIVKSAWKGSRVVATVVIGGLALGLGLKAFNSVNGD